MSISIMSHIWRHSPQKGNSLLVLLAIADAANDEGKCYPGVGRIAQKARISKRAVQTILRQLERDGELRVETNAGTKTKYGNTNLYTVILKQEGVNQASSLEVRGMHRDSPPKRNGVNQASPRQHEGVNQASPESSVNESPVNEEPPDKNNRANPVTAKIVPTNEQQVFSPIGESLIKSIPENAGLNAATSYQPVSDSSDRIADGSDLVTETDIQFEEEKEPTVWDSQTVAQQTSVELEQTAQRLMRVYQQIIGKAFPEKNLDKLQEYISQYPEHRIADAFRKSKETNQPVGDILKAETSVPNTGSNLSQDTPENENGQHKKNDSDGVEVSEYPKTQKRAFLSDKEAISFYDHNALLEMVRKTFKVSHGVDLRILTLLRGTAKKGEWKAFRLPPERLLDAEQLNHWAAWYRRTYPKQTLPERAEAISKYVNRWWDAGCPKSGTGGSHQEVGHQPHKVYDADDPVYKTKPELDAIYDAIDWEKI